MAVLRTSVVTGVTSCSQPFAFQNRNGSNDKACLLVIAHILPMSGEGLITPLFKGGPQCQESATDRTKTEYRKASWIPGASWDELASGHLIGEPPSVEPVAFQQFPQVSALLSGRAGRAAYIAAMLGHETGEVLAARTPQGCAVSDS
jgi:hypothetical protein